MKTYYKSPRIKAMAIAPIPIMAASPNYIDKDGYEINADFSKTGVEDIDDAV